MLDDNYDPRAEIENLHANLHQPDKFAEIFCKVARTQKSVDQVFKEMFINLLKTDKDVFDEVKKIFKLIETENWWNNLIKIRSGIWAILLLAIGAAINHFYA
ncbi:MAG TPA: hypothetical protein VLJ15_03505 [Gammaproteobacteria bacterium]|nr:hypothetical protein [Gammaproteobacteria bacterium]